MPNGNRCPLCEGNAHGRGSPVTLAQYYDLDTGARADGRAVYRLRQLSAVLSINPKCTCGLKALPPPELAVYFVEAAEPNLRNQFNRQREKILEALGEEGVEQLVVDESAGVIKRYPMVTKADENMLCHIVPLVAGGCFKSPKNIVPIYRMCQLCQWIDALCTQWQSEHTWSLEVHIERRDIEKFAEDFLAWVIETAHRDYVETYEALAKKCLDL